MKNILLLSDSYKYTHKEQYPEGLKYMHSYIESRGGSYGVTQFFGLQYYLKEYLSKPITLEMIDEAEKVITSQGLDFDRSVWEYILKEHNGYLPIRIRAVREGVVVNNYNVLITVESLDEKCAHIVSFFETLILKVWYPITVATLTHSFKSMMKYFLDLTSDNKEVINAMLHDFGYRGVSSNESAGIGGMSHLVNYIGTDNVAAIIYANKYYNAKTNFLSVPAAEHSTITSWEKSKEKEAYENILDKFPDKVVSIVVDSYNYYNAIENIISKQLVDKIKSRKLPVVLRPDSGDSIVNILFALENISQVFGYTINSKGYKVLNNIRILQGDGINENTTWDILRTLKDNGYSVENVILGCGGSLLQGNKESQINRDVHRFAMKCSCVKINDKFVDVYKAPVTDRGKVSKKGRLDLIKVNGVYKTVNIDNLPLNTYHPQSELITVFENGKIIKEYSMEEIRKVGEEYQIEGGSRWLNYYLK